jgi:hypothetical protein
MIYRMDLESCILLIDKNIKVNLSIVKNQDMELTITKTEASIQGTF